MSLYARLAPKGRNGFGYASTAEEVTAALDLTGKTILITGCNSGIGLETARVLTARGARVFGAGRTLEKASSALGPFLGTTQGFACELARPGSVRSCVKAVQAALAGAKLDAVICNAGIMALPKLEQAFGYELQFFTNHVGHFMLVTGLLDDVADAGRVVMLSSGAHRRAPAGGIEFDNLSGKRGYQPWKAYGQSKLANLLFAKELAQRFAGTPRTANALHPGVIRTNLNRHMNPAVQFAYGLGEALVFKDVAQGAATTCYVAVHPGAASVSGKYFSDCHVAAPRKDGTDMETAQRLWKVTEEIVAALP